MPADVIFVGIVDLANVSDGQQDNKPRSCMKSFGRLRALTRGGQYAFLSYTS
jgi:hypothetical protein